LFPTKAGVCLVYENGSIGILGTDHLLRANVGETVLYADLFVFNDETFISILVKAKDRTILRYFRLTSEIDIWNERELSITGKCLAFAVSMEFLAIVCK
jgi:hypothetical protein